MKKPTTLGGRIRSARLAAGYVTGSAFARKIGVFPQSLSQYETGRVCPSATALLKIARGLDVTTDSLLEGHSAELSASAGEVVELLETSVPALLDALQDAGRDMTAERVQWLMDELRDLSVGQTA